MKYFLLILCVIFLAACQPANDQDPGPVTILNGKIKTLKWYDTTNTLLATYHFIYNDSTGELIKVKNDTADFLVIEQISTDSVKLSYTEYIMNNPWHSIKYVRLDADTNVTAIYDYSLFSGLSTLEYQFYYAGGILQISYERTAPNVHPPPHPYYSIINPLANSQYVYNSGNCTEFKCTWAFEMFTWPFYAPVNYTDTISCTFTGLVNDGQVPLQFPFRCPEWNGRNSPVGAMGNNMLYMLGLKGFGRQVNNNLIRTLSMSGSENYTLTYDYVMNGSGQVTAMSITSSQTGFVTNSFEMEYWE